MLRAMRSRIDGPLLFRCWAGVSVVGLMFMGAVRVVTGVGGV